jgi:hypothetical protein
MASASRLSVNNQPVLLANWDLADTEGRCALSLNFSPTPEDTAGIAQGRLVDRVGSHFPVRMYGWGWCTIELGEPLHRNHMPLRFQRIEAASR